MVRVTVDCGVKFVPANSIVEPGTPKFGSRVIVARTTVRVVVAVTVLPVVSVALTCMVYVPGVVGAFSVAVQVPVSGVPVVRLRAVPFAVTDVVVTLFETETDIV